jgi:hypothetical protein
MIDIARKAPKKPLLRNPKETKHLSKNNAKYKNRSATVQIEE